MEVGRDARLDVMRRGLLAAGVPTEHLDPFVSVTDEIVTTESGWHPNGVAFDDSSYRGPEWLFGANNSRLMADGRPYATPRGVAQLTPWMFERYHVAGTPADIFDPVASIAALWRFIAAHFAVDLKTAAGLEQFHTVWFDHRHEWWWLTELAPFNPPQPRLPGY